MKSNNKKNNSTDTVINEEKSINENIELNADDNKNKKKSTLLKTIMKTYLLLYFIIMLIFCTIVGSTANGEWDDYVLPAVSIIAQHNFEIDYEDIAVFRENFPEFNRYSLSFSPYKAKDSDAKLPWYFPSYSIACVPLVVLLKVLINKPFYAFTYTNLALIMFLICFCYKFLKVSNKKKLVLIIALSINPIIFYLSWATAEIMMYVFIGIAIMCWYNKWYKRAALSISIAGTLNPTILCTGIIMILDYLINIIRSKKKDEKIVDFIKRNILDVIKYASCYIIALIPFCYYFYQVGHINLTASLSYHFDGKETILQRFLAYLFDINMGLLPYFSFILLISLALIPIAFYKKHWNYIKMMAAFFINIILVSIMVNINHGMSGIARYNAWGSIIMVLAVCIYWDELIKGAVIKKIVTCLIILSLILTGLIVVGYGGINSPNTFYLTMNPIAKQVLEYVPWLYNPLHSTFNSRVNFKDGGYEYDTPIIYCNDDGLVKKILATDKDKEYLQEHLEVIHGDKNWLEEKIDSLPSDETYISIPYGYEITKK